MSLHCPTCHTHVVDVQWLNWDPLQCRTRCLQCGREEWLEFTEVTSKKVVKGKIKERGEK